MSSLVNGKAFYEGKPTLILYICKTFVAIMKDLKTSAEAARPRALFPGRALSVAACRT
jgi:hypothetical protein